MRFCNFYDLKMSLAVNGGYDGWDESCVGGNVGCSGGSSGDNRSVSSGQI